jgi:hypothetical protein
MVSLISGPVVYACPNPSIETKVISPSSSHCPPALLCQFRVSVIAGGDLGGTRAVPFVYIKSEEIVKVAVCDKVVGSAVHVIYRHRPAGIAAAGSPPEDSRNRERMPQICRLPYTSASSSSCHPSKIPFQRPYCGRHYSARHGIDDGQHEFHVITAGTEIPSAAIGLRVYDNEFLLCRVGDVIPFRR